MDCKNIAIFQFPQVCLLSGINNYLKSAFVSIKSSKGQRLARVGEKNPPDGCSVESLGERRPHHLADPVTGSQGLIERCQNNSLAKAHLVSVKRNFCSPSALMTSYYSGFHRTVWPLAFHLCQGHDQPGKACVEGKNISWSLASSVPGGSDSRWSQEASIELFSSS